MEERIAARGHPNVSADHGSTFEVTTERTLTTAGDCIIGVAADRAPSDFDPGFVRACQDDRATVSIRLAAGGAASTVTGRGDPELTFADTQSAVARTSAYVDDRTILVDADAAAVDLDRRLVAALTAGADLTVSVRVE